MIFDLCVVLILVLLNGLLAMSELAVISARRPRLKEMADAGSIGALRALKLAEQPGHFLSTVQVGITLVGLVAGAYSGASLGEPVAHWLEWLGIPDHASRFLAVGAVLLVVLFASLVLGELVPKHLALHNPEAVAARVGTPMLMLTRMVWPLVVVLEAATRGVLGWLSRGPPKAPKVTREDVRALVIEAESAGIVAPQARAMMAGVMRLSDRTVRGIMTPRSDVDWIDVNESDEQIRARLLATPHSRLPVARSSLDAVIGAVRTKDLLDAYLAGQIPDLRTLIKQAPVVPDSVPALKAMEVLRGSGVHMVLVVDEYGTFQGLITTTNLLETIAGAFPIGTELPLPCGVRREDGSWLLDGDLPVDEMAELLRLRPVPSGDFHTVAGFLLSQLEHIPRDGEALVYRSWRFEVIDMDDRRIDKVIASPASVRRQQV